jgi:hypothetical protein
VSPISKCGISFFRHLLSTLSNSTVFTALTPDTDRYYKKPVTVRFTAGYADPPFKAGIITLLVAITSVF